MSNVEGEVYLSWKNSNICSINHTVSSGPMEVAGVKTIYHRSKEKHRLPVTLVMVLRTNLQR